jgi:uncharacterized membrane protein
MTAMPVRPSPVIPPAASHSGPAPGASQVRPPSHLSEQSSTGLPPRVAAVLCYAAAWVSGLVLLAIERESRFVRFHAWQSVLAFGGLTTLAIGCWIVTVLMAFVSPTAFRVMAWVTQIAWMVLIAAWLAAVVFAAQGKRWKMPLVGKRADRLSSVS